MSKIINAAENWFSERRMKTYIRDSHYESFAEYYHDLDEAIEHLTELKNNKELILYANKRIDCAHEEYLGATFTDRKMLMGWTTVYERRCGSCGHIERFSNPDNEKDDSLPAWTDGASKQYYNNNI